MLDLKLLSGELDARREEIVGYDGETSSTGKLYADRLRLLDDLDLSVNTQLGPYSGSKVLEEGPFIRRFGQGFPSRQEATDWALGVLKDRNVAAVDGSQIYPSRHISVPIGLVQACTVVNSHNGDRRFATDAKLHLMLPADFEENGSYVFAQAPVSTKRFELECQQIGAFMRSHPGDMVFLDGSLVLSFTGQQEEKEQARYVRAITDLLDVSEETRSPLIAYTDMSMSKDILTLMRHAFSLPQSGHLTDAFLISDRMRWGDRTRAFACDRDDRLQKGQKSTLDLYGRHRDNVAFFFIMSGGHLASKVEVPRWCFDEGLMEKIADTIRAECIIRPGYPDIIHRAHEYASISFAEAGMFRGMIDAFAAKHRIKIYKSAKELNKQL
ncbi:MAG: NurA domain protein [Methanocella sp. PtaU1.Bin125]|nr:MAG: NurA domain protein [Methanocella sp. PtaU1.Bin125]